MFVSRFWLKNIHLVRIYVKTIHFICFFVAGLWLLFADFILEKINFSLLLLWIYNLQMIYV